MGFEALLLENLHPDADEALQTLGPIGVKRVNGSPERAALEAEVKGATVLGIRSRTQVDAKLLEAAGSLEAVACFCIGTNQVDLDEAARRGVPVFNAPFANTRSVAELTLGSIIMLLRRIPEKMAGMAKGEWLKTAEGSGEVRGKTLGIVGYGNIGAQLSVLASGLGMHVKYVDIVPKLAHGNARRVESLDALLPACDVVTLHVPSTPRTRGFVGKRELALMKPTAVLINHARGDLVDMDALAEALRNQTIAGAACDVFPKEPKSKHEPFSSPLLQGCPNVLLTPHVGGSTLEAQQAIGVDAATKLAKYLYEGTTTQAVNFPHVDPGPLAPGRTRLLVPHVNRPGFMRRLNDAAEQAGANVAAQFLQTQGDLGYAVADLENLQVPQAFLDSVNALDGTIRARLIYTSN